MNAPAHVTAVAAEVQTMFTEDCRAAARGFGDAPITAFADEKGVFWIGEVLTDMQTGTSEGMSIVTARKRWRAALGLPPL